MDHDHDHDHNPEEEAESSSDFEDAQDHLRPRELPIDLPRSLDDRKTFTGYNEETEMYDAWQGMRSSLSCCILLFRLLTIFEQVSHSSSPRQQ